MSNLNDSESTNQVAPRKWSDYYQAVANRPPRETLLTALKNFERENKTDSRTSIDLGCGAGRDTVELLRRGWKVVAIDSQQEAIERLKNYCYSEKCGLGGFPQEQLFQDSETLLETRLSRFENIDLPSGVDLINASFSLPFCEPDSFPDLWNKIFSSLISGGRFCGQLFGDKDSWNQDSNMNFHSLSDIDLLLKDFTVELLSEEEHPGKTALGDEKYWHIFHIVARKK
ncbi:type 12 methyltransferase [Calothrix parasitica NIES-267]|uniref:Type 12 methyltransferase n=1 Tax=Calothrix parasitica NIES-267 TaxID=1973488 RepID=A0A1Z4LXV1_9CYAN|nr:type 12 methyltransferase [Calothrix parasitica NIES-267]